MKIKYALLLSALISTSVMADGIKLDKEYSAKTKQEIKSLMGAYTYAKTQAFPQNGLVLHNIKVKSYHEIFLSNPSADHDMTYTYNYELCATDQGCLHVSQSKILHPQETFTEGHWIEGYVGYGKTGTYKLSSATTIQGEYNEDARDQQIFSIY